MKHLVSCFLFSDISPCSWSQHPLITGLASMAKASQAYVRKTYHKSAQVHFQPPSSSVCCVFNVFLLCPPCLWFNSASTPSLLPQFSWSPCLHNWLRASGPLWFSKCPLLRMAYTNSPGRVDLSLKSHIYLLDPNYFLNHSYFISSTCPTPPSHSP